MTNKDFICSNCKKYVPILHPIQNKELCYHCFNILHPPFEFEKFLITKEIKQKADDRTKKILESARLNNLKPKFQTNEYENHFIGCVGEVLIYDYFLSKNIDFVKELVYGKSDEADFWINGHSIDIKTGHRIELVKNLNPYYSNFSIFIPFNQTLKDYYIIMMLDKDIENGYLLGYIDKQRLMSFEPIKDFRMVNKAYSLKISDLAPISKFFKEVQK